MIKVATSKNVTAPPVELAFRVLKTFQRINEGSSAKHIKYDERADFPYASNHFGFTTDIKRIKR